MLKFYEMFIHPRVPPFSISYEYWMLKCLTPWVMITLRQHPAELVPPSSMTMDPKSSPTSLAEALPPSISRQIPASQHQRRHWHRRCQGEGSLPRNMFNSFKVGSSHGSTDPLNPSPLVHASKGLQEMDGIQPLLLLAQDSQGHGQILPRAQERATLYNQGLLHACHD